MTDSITNRSGGIDFNAQQVSITGDVAGRDIIKQEAPAPIVQSLHQLPAPPADFIGRTVETDTILTDLQHSAVITGIRGLGGIGKTALALVIADRVKARYPDAQFFINLQGTSDNPLSSRDALAHVVRGFHPVEKLPDDEAGLRAQYLSDLHNKRALILLDDARDAEQVKPLLPPASCLLLITSRQHFHLPGLHATDLDALLRDDARQLLLEMAPRLTSVILSAEGAKNLLVDHPEILRHLTIAQNDIVQMVDVIADLCAYLPLALRVAGSFLAERPDFDVTLYVRRLSDNRLKQFSEVNSALQVSYDLLTTELQRLWRQLAVFPADFDRDAAKSVWDVDEDTAQDALSELARYSLMEYKTRYRLHDLARLFADKRLSEDERYATQRRHAEHFSQAFRNANQMLLEGGDTMMGGLALFDAEWPNIQQGQKWSQEHASRDTEAAKLCNSYGWQWSLLSLRFHPREQIQWTMAALDAARVLENSKAEGAHLGNLGLAHAALGETHKAIEFYEQSLKINREIGDQRGESADLGNLGLAYADLGETRKAIEFYEQRLVIARNIGDRRGEGRALSSLGVAYKNLGETHKAMEFHEQRLVIAREIGDRQGEGIALGNLGLAYAALGETRKAIELYEQHRDIASGIGDRRGEANALMNIGNAHYDLGEYRRAIEYHKQALPVFRGIGDRRGEGNALWNMALALDELSECEKAIAHAEASLKIYEQIEGPWAEKVRLQLAQWKRE